VGDLDPLDDVFPQYDESPRAPTVKGNPRELVDQTTGNTVRLDPFDTSLMGNGVPNYVLDPSSLENAKFPPIDDPATMEMLKVAAELDDQRNIREGSVFHSGVGVTSGFDKEAAWIQTYSGRRFNPTKPNPDAIVIQDIAHSLSMQCRFTGHTKKFYSVAQHSVLVSHICNDEDALWGLLHDASEAYLIDVPRPLKQSGKFNAYLEFEAKMQEAICKRFGLPYKEPPSVKRADTKLLATEARDLMSPLHSDWIQRATPLPFTIEAWDQQKAKDMFMQRFFELIGADPSNYEHYLRHRDVL
jgi:hypothetical protein